MNAWCYWWKGYAYSQIGTMYYSGLIQDDPSTLPITIIFRRIPSSPESIIT